MLVNLPFLMAMGPRSLRVPSPALFVFARESICKICQVM
jgi:hypothetical protein